MKLFKAILLFFALVVAPALPCLAQQRQDPQDEEVITVGSNEILLDAVVKDKKGHVVKDLKPSDVEVYEDGVRQEVKSFRLVTRGAAASSSAADTSNAPTTGDNEAAAPNRSAERARPASATRLSAVALVFDRLSPDARARARTAALTYVGDEASRQDDFIGVFGIDLSLHAFQSFTNDAQLVRAAIDRATAHAPASFASGTAQSTEATQTQLGLQSQADASAGTLTSAAPVGSGQGLAGQSAPGAGDVASAGSTAAAAQFAAMTERAVEGFERLSRSQQGYATTEGLLAIVNAMGRLPGRKALVLFSEGVAIPPAVLHHFTSVISAANRANVSIYAVDAAGLRATSADAEAGRAMIALGRKRAAIAGSPSDGTGGPMSRDLERNEDLMRLNPESGLGQLADQTGGILVSNTNNPGTRLRQVDEDLHAYYLVSYSPSNQNFDGRFRRINLKVNRSGVDVQARKGYFAVANTYDTPVLDYEAPALALLEGRKQSNAFASRVAAFDFPERGRPGLVPVMVEVPAGSINFTTAADKKSYAADFAVVVLVKDEGGHVVRKLSNEYLLGGPLDQLAAAKQGKVLFYRETRLPPGRYSLSAIVYDATNSRASTDTSSLTVEASDESRLRLSSVVLIKSAEKLTAAEAASPRPFNFGEVAIYPNMGEPVRKSATKTLAFFVTAYAPRGSNSTTHLKMEVVQQGRALGQTSYDLPAPDASGRIQYAGAIPIDKYKPGDYELRVTVNDAQTTATRGERFTITP
ncbi:MAG TPA: VWA domain-containing protein [Pyrinomonadaceae bacterium]|jgi:VWFA-related protein|nr:VWA domain-containing protein [Pyrinomonadaceae bacterium]